MLGGWFHPNSTLTPLLGYLRKELLDKSSDISEKTFLQMLDMHFYIKVTFRHLHRAHPMPRYVKIPERES